MIRYYSALKDYDTLPFPQEARWHIPGGNLVGRVIRKENEGEAEFKHRVQGIVKEYYAN